MNTAPRPRQRPPLALVAGVLLVHALLLGPPPPIAAPARPPLAAPVLVRTVQPPAPQPIAAPPAPPLALTPAAAPRSTLAVPAPRPKPAAKPAPARSTVAAAAPVARVAVSEQAPASSATVTTRPDAAPPSSAPTAPVQLAESATLDYRVSGTARGLPFEAEAQLVWRREAARYQAEWVVRLPLLGQRVQRSAGAVTRAGLAPERYAEQARGERAAHFDAEGGRIRFSANTPDAALQPGAQDRLTVSLQLGGLIAAAPERYPPGSSLTLQTAGVREAEPWRWDVQEDETLHIDGQALPCTKLVRHPRKDYDTRVELWLARTLDYLPARLRVTQANGDVADQQLQALPDRR